jgi:hypothetical protein
MGASCPSSYTAATPESTPLLLFSLEYRRRLEYLQVTLRCATSVLPFLLSKSLIRIEHVVSAVEMNAFLPLHPAWLMFRDWGWRLLVGNPTGRACR